MVLINVSVHEDWATGYMVLGKLFVDRGKLDTWF